MMKRTHSIFCVLALAACCFLAGCGGGEANASAQEPTSAPDTPATTTKLSYQLPTVDSMDQKALTSRVKQTIETIYGIDLTGWEAYFSVADTPGKDEQSVAFTGADGEAPYMADIDPETKQIIAIETAAPKSAVPSDAARQTEYVDAAKAFAETLFQATGLEESTCYQPVQPISGQVTSDSVYVVFPEIQTYVEVSADEGHALVGYRHFADEQALSQFLERQGKVF